LRQPDEGVPAGHPAAHPAASAAVARHAPGRAAAPRPAYAVGTFAALADFATDGQRLAGGAFIGAESAVLRLGGIRCDDGECHGYNHGKE